MEKSRKNWPRYAGGAAIILFAVLLAIRLGGFQRFIVGKTNRIFEQQRIKPVGEIWFSISQNGRKIGYTNRSLTRMEDGGFRLKENIFMRINTIGVIQPVVVKTSAILNEDGTLSSFEFDLGSNLFMFNAAGAVDQGRLAIKSGSRGAETTSTIALDEPIYLGGGILESGGIDGLKPGEKRRFQVFDPASLGHRIVSVTMLGPASLNIKGKNIQVRKVSVDFMGMKQTAWMDSNGTVIREDGILGIVLERGERDDVMAGYENAVSADLAEIAAIPSPRKIDQKENIKLLKVRLHGLDDHFRFLDGGRQDYRDGAVTVRLESGRNGPDRLQNMGGDVSKFLKPTPFIQSDHDKIRRQLKKIVDSQDRDLVKAKKIVQWIFRNVEKRPVLSIPNAVETLENRVGDCNEHAVLMAAFARAAGIPADIEAGIVYMKGRFFYHAWNVLYLPEKGGWITVDATLGQMPADVTHIRFVRGEADNQLDLVGLIGKLKIDILEMK